MRLRGSLGQSKGLLHPQTLFATSTHCIRKRGVCLFSTASSASGSDSYVDLERRMDSQSISGTLGRQAAVNVTPTEKSSENTHALRHSICNASVEDRGSKSGVGSAGLTECVAASTLWILQIFAGVNLSISMTMHAKVLKYSNLNQKTIACKLDLHIIPFSKREQISFNKLWIQIQSINERNKGRANQNKLLRFAEACQ